MTEQRAYCCEESRAIDEPIYGSADHVHVWLLLEYRVTWRARPVEDNDLPATVNAWLSRGIDAAAGRGLKGRIQFLRQPERNVSDLALFVALTDDRASSLYRFELDGYDHLDSIDVGELLDRPDAFAEHLENDSISLVCTNGQRDVCCARFGRPVYEHLSKRLGERIWQTTHLGGHRFAPNVAFMPEGLVYGRVDIPLADDLVDAHRDGKMRTVLLRGRSCYSREVQAAEYFLRTKTGRDAIDAFHLVSTEALGPNRTKVVFHDEDGDNHVVNVEQREGALEVLKSCREEAAEPVDTYHAI
jgi:hypothetical protein